MVPQTASKAVTSQGAGDAKLIKCWIRERRLPAHVPSFQVETASHILYVTGDVIHQLHSGNNYRILLCLYGPQI